jgi:D-glycero-D-manno-heptose 1,7-bisphosphate phosphatase
MTGRRDKLRPAVFLDRDGTLNEDIGFMDRMEALSLFSWTADAIRLLNRAGYCTVVTTNQSAVARGLIDEEFLRVVHQEIDRRLARGDARIDRYFYCPHHPEAPLEAYRRICECRKPRPGMILAAARELGLDLTRSVMVGDRRLDVASGHAAGVRAVLVRTGLGAAEEEDLVEDPGAQPDAILNNLMEAVGWILRNSSRS